MSEKEKLLRHVFRNQKQIDVEHWNATSRALDKLIVFKDKQENGKTVYVYPAELEA